MARAGTDMRRSRLEYFSGLENKLIRQEDSAEIRRFLGEVLGRSLPNRMAVERLLGQMEDMKTRGLVR